MAKKKAAVAVAKVSPEDAVKQFLESKGKKFGRFGKPLQNLVVKRLVAAHAASGSVQSLLDWLIANGPALIALVETIIKLFPKK